MEEPTPDTSAALPLQELERAASRLGALTESEGLGQVARGVKTIRGELNHREWTPARLEALVRAVDALADLFGADTAADSESEVERDETPTAEIEGSTVDAGMARFIAGFRAEAQKRLAGLSLSMMRIFNSPSDPAAIEQSVAHLHAIRGGAAMLGLSGVASLSGAMEDVILATRRLPPERRQWPVKALLRGFSLLEAAVEAPEEATQELLAPALQDLGGGRPTSRPKPPPPPPTNAAAPSPKKGGGNPFADAPITDVHARPLEKRILVVDDVETIAASVGLILSELDIPVDVAHDGAHALEMLHEHPYSLVISDVQMPGMSGLGLTRAMRRDDALVDIPVILLTALDSDAERQVGLQSGADDYIVKGSIGGGELVSRVVELLEDAPSVPAVEEEEAVTRRRILVVEDTETVAASIAFVLSEGDYEIVLAHDGMDALHRLEGRPFDLIISDVDMPSMDGLTLLERVREQPGGDEVPFVLLTARDSAESRTRARKAGVDRFLIKGDIGGGSLLELVARLIDEGHAAEVDPAPATGG